MLVAGSYPPALSAAADATVAAARREIEAGRAVITVAPRASGASRTVALGGPGTARRLDLLRQETGADGLVLSIETGIPLLAATRPAVAKPLWRIVDFITLALLRPRLRRFGHVTLLVSSTGPDIDRALRYLKTVADEIAATHQAAAALPTTAAPSASATGATTAFQLVDAPTLGPAYAGITAAGPPEPAIVRLRRNGARAGRRALGPLYKPLRLLAWPLERIVPAARRRWHKIRGIS